MISQMKQASGQQHEVVYLDTKVVNFVPDKIDTRFSTEMPESSDLQSLISSIRIHGIKTAITVRPKVNGQYRYEVVAGNRRLTAAKFLKLATVPAIVKELSDAEAVIEGLTENFHRKDTSAIEKAKGIALVYKSSANMTPQQAIIKLNRLHNFLNKLGKQQLYVTQSDVESDTAATEGKDSELTKEFLDAFNQLGVAANTQYKFLKLITELPQEAQDALEYSKVGLHKAELLTHAKLREHPVIQHELAKEITQPGLPISTVRYKVRQTISDLETGVLEKQDDGTYNIDYYNREDIRKPETENEEFRYKIPKIYEEMTKLIGRMLNRPIYSGEYFYELKTVEPKLAELKRNLRQVPRRDIEGGLAIHAAIMELICKTIREVAE